MEEADLMARSSQPMSSQPSPRCKPVRAPDSLLQARKPKKKKQADGDVVKAVKNSAWGRESSFTPSINPRKGSSPKKQLMEVVIPSSSASKRITPSQEKAPWLSQPASSFDGHSLTVSGSRPFAESSKQARERLNPPSSTRPSGMSRTANATRSAYDNQNTSVPGHSSATNIKRRTTTVDHLKRRNDAISSDSDTDELNIGRTSKKCTTPNKRRKTPMKKPPSQASQNVYSDSDSDVWPIGNDRTGRPKSATNAISSGKIAITTIVGPAKLPAPELSSSTVRKPNRRARTRIDSSPDSDGQKAGVQRNSASPSPVRIIPRITEDWFAEIERKRLEGVKIDKKGESARDEFEILDLTSSQPCSPTKLSDAAGAMLHRTKPARSGPRQMFTDLNEMDAEYCESVLSLDSLCPYCNEPMPAIPSPALLNLQSRLYDISLPAPTADNPSARSAPWGQTIGLCTLHKAESTIIPLGLRDGYPNAVDFDNIPSRVDGTHFWRAINLLCADPDEWSTWFRATRKKIEQQGKRTWQSLAQQSRQKRMDLIQPGYYGDTGKLVLTRHFQRRLQVGDLIALTDIPPGKTHPVTHPLSTDEFIINILVPEAATFLVMEDQGWIDKPFTKQTEGYEAARQRAFETVRSSVEFGRALFREDAAQVPQSLLGDLQRRQTQGCADLPVYRPSPSTPRRRKQVYVEIPSPVSRVKRPAHHTSITLDSSPLAAGPEGIIIPCSSPPTSLPRRHRSASQPSSSPLRVNLEDFRDSDEDMDMIGGSSAGTEVSDSDIEELGCQLRTVGSVQLLPSRQDYFRASDVHWVATYPAGEKRAIDNDLRRRPGSVTTSSRTSAESPVYSPTPTLARQQRKPQARSPVRHLGLRPQARP